MPSLLPVSEPSPVRNYSPEFVARKWQKGFAPNPGGKGGEYQKCQQLCKAAAAESVAEIVRLRDHSDDDRVRYMAATWLYERAWGKVKEYDPAKDGEGAVPAFDPSKLSPQQLAAVKQAMMVLLQASMPNDEGTQEQPSENIP